MEDIEEYQDAIEDMREEIEIKFEKFNSANNAEKPNIVTSIERYIENMDENIKMFKKEMFQMPKSQEFEYKQKLNEYQDLIETYRGQLKRNERELMNSDQELVGRGF
jgi:hypothetical protein